MTEDLFVTCTFAGINNSFLMFTKRANLSNENFHSLIKQLVIVFNEGFDQIVKIKQIYSLGIIFQQKNIPTNSKYKHIIENKKKLWHLSVLKSKIYLLLINYF
jgi:hypothetical protein